MLYPCSIWLMHMERIKYNTVSSHEIKKWQPLQLNADATKTPILLISNSGFFFVCLFFLTPAVLNLVICELIGFSCTFVLLCFFYSLRLMSEPLYTLELNFNSSIILQGNQENM